MRRFTPGDEYDARAPRRLCGHNCVRACLHACLRFASPSRVRRECLRRCLRLTSRTAEPLAASSVVASRTAEPLAGALPPDE